MKKILLSLVYLLIITFSSFAQVGIGTNNPDSSAILELFAVDKGILIPRMTTDQRNTIKDNITLANGLMIFDTNLNKFFYWNESDNLWISINNWVSEGSTSDDIYYTESGNVGIGTNTPSEKLDVNGNTNITGNVQVTGNASTTGNVSATGEFIGDGSIPIGGIIMWSGSTAPDGWAICNGQTINGYETPDLRGRFIVGNDLGDTDFDGIGNHSTGGTTDGETGGNKSHSHTVNNHTHTVDPPNTNTSYTGGSEGIAAVHENDGWPGNHRHSVNIAQFNSGGASPGTSTSTHLNPYYVLAFIMRVR